MPVAPDGQLVIQSALHIVQKLSLCIHYQLPLVDAHTYKMFNATVIALIGVNSAGSPRAASLVHQMSHLGWPLLVHPARIGTPDTKTKNTNNQTNI